MAADPAVDAIPDEAIRNVETVFAAIRDKDASPGTGADPGDESDVDDPPSERRPESATATDPASAKDWLDPSLLEAAAKAKLSHTDIEGIRKLGEGPGRKYLEALREQQRRADRIAGEYGALKQQQPKQQEPANAPPASKSPLREAVLERARKFTGDDAQAQELLDVLAPVLESAERNEQEKAESRSRAEIEAFGSAVRQTWEKAEYAKDVYGDGPDDALTDEQRGARADVALLGRAIQIGLQNQGIAADEATITRLAHNAIVFDRAKTLIRNNIVTEANKAKRGMTIPPSATRNASASSGVVQSPTTGNEYSSDAVARLNKVIEKVLPG